jgi:hypothetical protein
MKNPALMTGFGGEAGSFFRMIRVLFIHHLGKTLLNGGYFVDNELE